MKVTAEHPDFTAALLGEGSPGRGVLLQEEIRRDPLLRREAAEVTAAVEMISSSLRRAAPDAALTPERRAAILRGERRLNAEPEMTPAPVWRAPSMRSAVVRPFWTRPAWIAAGIAAAAALTFSLLPGIPGAWEWKDHKAAPVAETEHGPDGLIRVRLGHPPKKLARQEGAPPSIPEFVPQVPGDTAPPVQNPGLNAASQEKSPSLETVSPESKPPAMVNREPQPPGPDNPEPTSADGNDRRSRQRPVKPSDIAIPRLKKTGR